MKKVNLAALFAAISMLPAVAVAADYNDDDPALAHECTSWMVFNNLTKNNTNILHKNRDSTEKKVKVMISPANAKRRWILLGTSSANSGMNSSGLASVVNSGELSIDHATDPTKKHTPQLVFECLTTCDTAAQAVEKLRGLIAAGDYQHGKSGSIFFFMDTKEGYICELTGKIVTVQRYDRDYAVRANIWYNPRMMMRSRSSFKSYMNSSGRAYMAFSGLNSALDKNGKITLTDIFELSRTWKMPKESKDKRSLCFRHTNSGSSLEIDRQYPDVLSTGYFTIGNPRHTLYVPVPVCAEKLLPGMDDYTWSNAAVARFNKLKLNAPIPEKWQKFEKVSMEKYTAAKDAARKLLKQGKRDEAVKLLNATAYGIWQEAEKLLIKK